MERYLDSHLHLQKKPLTLAIDSILGRAGIARISRMFCNGTREEDWQAVVSLAVKEPGVIIPFLGIHPWFAEDVAVGWEERLLFLLVQVPAGIGEIGLDKSCRTDFCNQQQIFLLQLQLASELRRPLSIHCVKAWGQLLEVLEACASRLPPTMIHSFGGSLETLQRLVRIGCFISFSSRMVADRKLHLCFQATPLENLLLETDAPGQAAKQLSPDPDIQNMIFNETAAIVPLYHAAARMRGMTMPEFCQRIWKNGEIFTDTILPR